MWVDPLKQMPKENDIIWILLYHTSKQEGIKSAEIYAGEVWSSQVGLYVMNNDCIGMGGRTWEFPSAGDGHEDCNKIQAWAPTSALKLPKWVKYDR